MYYVYILHSDSDGNRYVGMTVDLIRRLDEHRSGKVRSTRHRRPLTLICYEAYRFRREAARRESFLKSSDGRKDLAKRFKIEGA